MAGGASSHREDGWRYALASPYAVARGGHQNAHKKEVAELRRSLKEDMENQQAKRARSDVPASHDQVLPPLEIDSSNGLKAGWKVGCANATEVGAVDSGKGACMGLTRVTHRRLRRLLAGRSNETLPHCARVAGVHLLKMAAELMVTGWFLSPIIKEMQDTALSYIRGQYSWKKDQEKDLERLNTMLTEILTIVDVIEKREIKNGNQRKLLGILKNAIYSAVDVLDSFQYMVLHSKVIRQSTVTLVTTSFVEMGKRMLGTTKFRRKLTDILEKLGEVKTSADTLLRVVTFDKATAKLLLVTQLRVTSPLKEKNHIYGRRAELDKLRDMLLEVSDNSEPGPSESSVPVISIVGVGGIGKTSLAQVAFNDEQIRMNFTHRIWVSVSDSYDEVRLARDILEYVTDANHHTATEFDELQNALHEKMEGKKFLLVLDDVWYDEDRTTWENEQLWSRVLCSLNTGLEGSKILLCFSFCSLFPKDWRFDPKMLTEMWVAHGFVQKEYPYDTDLDTEDVAKVYFDELVQRSFFERSWLNLPTELPASVKVLKHLRYFAFRVPERPWQTSLIRLYQLEVLVTRGHSCRESERIDLPINMKKNLLKLRKAYLFHLGGTTISGFGGQTLVHGQGEFHVKKESGYRLGELKDMKHIREQLKIRFLENIEHQQEAINACLDCKEHIQTLELEWSLHAKALTSELDYDVINALRPHPNLNRLKIFGYRGTSSPCWFETNWLTALNSLVLENCTGWVHLPPLGQIPLLKYLELRNMHAVRKIGPEFYENGDTKGFPRLEDIVFDGMHNWEHWSGMDGGSLLPCLERLYITKCPKLTESPAFSATPRVEVEITSNFLLMSDGLPASMQMILLSRCHPEFDSQLQRKEGAEWNKIAHIPEKKLEVEVLLSGKHDDYMGLLQKT
ncbi:hypothetical protein PR202_gb27918 [Eleusine coracana subsp. coracana]|uniref:NB-ARC domain-containing protein n=1 Tax=Eleusine coracana subsp. coracana TaxID=191504 RepID=A0AAV5FVW9_ELECO|nr:hypothetical protein PR202_gb27918 [Eleusine coracana subsp. coracana]